jgi:hypothetical protein
MLDFRAQNEATTQMLRRRRNGCSPLVNCRERLLIAVDLSASGCTRFVAERRFCAAVAAPLSSLQEDPST